MVGANFSTPFGPGWRWTAFLGSTIPFGSGGGDSPDAGAAAAISAGISARSAMDNSIFAVNDWTGIVGVGLARITPELTLQAEVTLFQAFRVRGPDTQDSARTNFTAGFHAGHFFSPDVSFGAEPRMQRWLSDVAPVDTARDLLLPGAGRSDGEEGLQHPPDRRALCVLIGSAREDRPRGEDRRAGSPRRRRGPGDLRYGRASSVRSGPGAKGKLTDPGR